MSQLVSWLTHFICQRDFIIGITGSYSGLDTSDATAIAREIRYGKIAYAKGARLVGQANRVFSSNASNNISKFPSGVDYTIPDDAIEWLLTIYPYIVANDYTYSEHVGGAFKVLGSSTLEYPLQRGSVILYVSYSGNKLHISSTTNITKYYMGSGNVAFAFDS